MGLQRWPCVPQPSGSGQCVRQLLVVSDYSSTATSHMHGQWSTTYAGYGGSWTLAHVMDTQHTTPTRDDEQCMFLYDSVL